MTIKATTRVILLALLAAGCGRAKDKLVATKARVLGTADAPGGSQDGGPTVDPSDPTRPETPGGLGAPGFNLKLQTFQTCDELTADVRAQLALRAANEAAMQQYSGSVGPFDGGVMGAGADVDMSNTAEDSASAPTTKDVADTGESFTNVQEKGVDESDFVKIGTAHLYVTRGAQVEVVDRETLEPLGKLALDGLKKLTLYAESDRLTMIGQLETPKKACHLVEQYRYDQAYGPQAMERKVVAERCFDYHESATIVRVYAAAPKAMPQLVSEHRFDDTYRDSRFIDGHVVLLFTSSLPLVTDANVAERCGLVEACYDIYYNASRYGYDAADPYLTYTFGADTVTIPEQPVAIAEDGTVGGVPCGAISKPFISDNDFRMTKVASLDTRRPDSLVKQAAAVGGGDQIYMTTTGLYIAKQGLRWIPWEAPTSDNGQLQNTWAKQQDLQDSLVVTKIAFSAETGELAVRAVGAVRGHVKDQWAFKEYADSRALAIATTTWSKVKPETTTEGQHNHLWILQEEGETLALKAAINDFGPTEDIRAARYMGTMAYIVTFKKTDPLFAFDLSDPLAPKLQGELKIPGFSMYLHPLADGRLLGVGYDADDQGDFAWFQGIQVSLFDTSDPTKLSRLDVHVIGHRGSYSDITGDHKAFFHNAEHNLIGIPVVEKVEAGGGGTGWEQAEAVKFSGAILYRLAGDKLEEAARITHSDLVPAVCSNQGDWHWWQDARRSLDINRLYEVDGRLVSVSRFGIKTYDPAAPAAGPTATVAFDGANAADCSTRDDVWSW